MTQIDLRAIKACSFAMSTEATRYYLNGVALEMSVDCIIAIATDGHRLIAIRAGDGIPGMTGKQILIIPADTVKQIKIKGGVSDAWIEKIEPNATMLTGLWGIKYGTETYAFRPVDGTFPKMWRKVCPRHTEQGEIAQFNPSYLNDMAKAQSVYWKTQIITVIHNGNNPAWVRFSDDVPGFGVIMPFGANNEMVIPDWSGITPAPKEVDEAA